MRFIVRTDQHAKPQDAGGSGNGDVVLGNRRSGFTLLGAVGDLRRLTKPDTKRAKFSSLDPGSKLTPLSRFNHPAGDIPHAAFRPPLGHVKFESVLVHLKTSMIGSTS